MTSCMTWLVPVAGPERERLTGATGRLAAEHGGPVFAPHVTLVDAFDGEVAAVAAALGPVAGWRRVARAPLAG
jgi:hypothetical protein